MKLISGFFKPIIKTTAVSRRNRMLPYAIVICRNTKLPQVAIL